MLSGPTRHWILNHAAFVGLEDENGKIVVTAPRLGLRVTPPDVEAFFVRVKKLAKAIEAEEDACRRAQPLIPRHSKWKFETVGGGRSGHQGVVLMRVQRWRWRRAPRKIGWHLGNHRQLRRHSAEDAFTRALYEEARRDFRSGG